MIPLVDLKAAYAKQKDEIDAAIQAVIDNTRFIQGQEVKDFARHMVEDHTKANTELMAIINKKGLARAAATTMPAEHRALVARLATLRGEDFDRAYMKQMVKDHEGDMKAFRHEAQAAAGELLGARAVDASTGDDHVACARRVQTARNAQRRGGRTGR